MFFGLKLTKNKKVGGEKDMWVRKVLMLLLLALFIFSIFGTAGAALRETQQTRVNPPPKTNNEDPWAGAENAGGKSAPTGNSIKSAAFQTNNSCSFIFIGNNIPVVVFKVEVKKPAF
jgi:hypothetical protein